MRTARLGRHMGPIGRMVSKPGKFPLCRWSLAGGVCICVQVFRHKSKVGGTFPVWYTVPYLTPLNYSTGMTVIGTDVTNVTFESQG